MQKKTDLEKVKTVARALLMTEIHETEFSLAVVQHPFTSSGITILTKEGILRLGNICKSEKDLAAWREYMKKRHGQVYRERGLDAIPKVRFDGRFRDQINGKIYLSETIDSVKKNMV